MENLERNIQQDFYRLDYEYVERFDHALNKMEQAREILLTVAERMKPAEEN
jgi:hypothetical protein